MVKQKETPNNWRIDSISRLFVPCETEFWYPTVLNLCSVRMNRLHLRIISKNTVLHVFFTFQKLTII